MMQILEELVPAEAASSLEEGFAAGIGNASALAALVSNRSAADPLPVAPSIVALHANALF
eukprot:CAMPEP_0115851056 /NCGR_PEP_ID=MMETSP0287-20121206/12282_1 /TAXON_ID=412157 /ORGANISM="Chrysochromulina rotalis, Strain UIO044" /LENGTH=59 /DNA_ID=CAMNT_0003305071 /DNA_START=721 /DNA_END=901 /DNA_ORIENTATION=+